MDDSEILMLLITHTLEFGRGFFLEFLDFNKIVQVAICIIAAGFLGYVTSSGSRFDAEGRLMTGAIFGVILVTMFATVLSKSYNGEPYWGFWFIVLLYWSCLSFFTLLIITNDR